MRDRGTLYVGILLIASGILFMFTQAAGILLSPIGIHFGWRQMWPFTILYVGFAFWLPIVLWWDRRQKIAGLIVPATIITVNGLLLLYQNLTGNWRSWAYLWTCEPLSIGLSLWALYHLCSRPRGLLTAAAIICGISMFFLVIFATAFGGIMSILGPAMLILVGIIIMLNSVNRHAKSQMPND